ncbi:hypothetical protein V6R21_32075 [Limibacter armeniacum]|uniref:hypothetical protein n=1 Tax=Limibacter armeniacum TaxID=466084 RepID=UPI002FE64215
MSRIIPLSLIVVLSCFISEVALSQQMVALEEKEITIKGNRMSAWVTTIESDIDQAKGDIKRFAKQEYGIRLKEKKSVLIAKEIKMKGITDKKGDVWVNVTPGVIPGTADAAFAYQLGYDVSLNSTDFPEAMSSMQQAVKEFIRYHYKNYYKNQIEEKEDRLKLLNKRAKKIEKEIKENEKLIKKSNKVVKKSGKREEVFDAEQTVITSEGKLSSLKVQLQHVEKEIITAEAELSTAQRHFTTIDKRID